MPVVSSTHTVGPVQIDGRRRVTETHTLNVGPAVVVRYLADDGADYAAIRDARVEQIDAQLAEAEAAEVLRQ